MILNRIQIALKYRFTFQAHIIQQESLEMTEAQIQMAIRDFIDSSRQNAYRQLTVGLNQPNQILPAGLPTFSLQQIRAICKAQEQTILEKVIPIKPYDLYEEIARICPEEQDIRTISSEEVAVRLSLYNTKLTLNEKMTCQSQSEESWESGKEESFFGEVKFDEMCLMKDDNNVQEEQTMRNIFDECDQQQNHWNTNQYFGLS